MREIDIDIIQKAALGDTDALEEVYKTFSSTVYSIAVGITRNSQDAEEATQDAFVKIFRNMRSFKFDSSFGTWIYRIAVNAAINVYRARQRRAAPMTRIEDAGDIHDPRSDAPRERLRNQDTKSKVAEMLETLSPEHRSCIVLREIEGLDYKEMADILDIPLNTVRSRLKRAREALVAYCRKKEVRYGL